MKAVFIVTSFWAYGELLIAKEFAKSLIANHHEVMFVIPPSHANALEKGIPYAILIPHSRKLNCITFREVQEKFQPNIVILSDFLNYTFSERHYGIEISDLKAFTCKIATFDNFDWKIERRAMDTYGFSSDVLRTVNIDLFGERIIPCPLGSPCQEQKKGEFRFSIFDEKQWMNCVDKVALRKKYMPQFDTTLKMVLVSRAKWQDSAVDDIRTKQFIRTCDLVYENLLKNLSKSMIVVSVGDRESTNLEYPNYISMGSLPPEEFDKYIRMADLYIGRNITSTSMIRIALSGVPCVNLQNSFTKMRVNTQRRIAEYVNMQNIDIGRMYKYKMFPVGWYDFLSPLMLDNPYSDIIYSCELFDIEETDRVINELLYDDSVKKVFYSKVFSLRGLLGNLQTPNEVVSNILQNT